MLRRSLTVRVCRSIDIFLICVSFWCRFVNVSVLEEEFVVVVQDVVIDFLLDSLDRVMDEAFDLLAAIRQAFALACQQVVRLLKIARARTVLSLLGLFL